MTAQSIFSKRPVLTFIAALFFLHKLFSSHIYRVPKLYYFAERCTDEIDGVFVLDSSSSVGEANFAIIRDFVVDLVREFNVGSDAAQVRKMLFESLKCWCKIKRNCKNVKASRKIGNLIYGRSIIHEFE